MRTMTKLERKRHITIASFGGKDFSKTHHSTPFPAATATTADGSNSNDSTTATTADSNNNDRQQKQ